MMLTKGSKFLKWISRYLITTTNFIFHQQIDAYSNMWFYWQADAIFWSFLKNLFLPTAFPNIILLIHVAINTPLSVLYLYSPCPLYNGGLNSHTTQLKNEIIALNRGINIHCKGINCGKKRKWTNNTNAIQMINCTLCLWPFRYFI